MVRAEARSRDLQHLTRFVIDHHEPVYLVNPPSVTPPKAIHTPDPEYTTSARQKHVTGTAKIMLVISDEGRPEIVQLTKDLGEGLDARALMAVSQWTKCRHPTRGQLGSSFNSA